MKRDLKRSLILLRSQIVVTAALIVLIMPILSAYKGEIVYTFVGIFLAFSAIYITAWNEGYRDSKKLGENIPDIPRSIKVSLMAAAVPAMLLVLRVIAYHICVKDGTQTSVFLKTTDVSYRLFYLYFTGFMKKGSLLEYVLPIIIQIVLYPVGYAVGTTRFDIREKILPKIMYKKKEEQQKK